MRVIVIKSSALKTVFDALYLFNYTQIKSLSQNYLSVDYDTARQLHQAKVVPNLLFIPCEQFPEPVVP